MPSAAADRPDITRYVDPATVARFARSLDWLGVPADEPVAVAVSGGADSTALLLLAVAARPGGVVAATVDHRLRPEAADEARGVARLCTTLGVPHAILPVTIVPIRGGPQASARQARYAALASWCPAPRLLTGHQRDDVAETLLMRLARGSGVRGLARMREESAGGGPILLRPLLDWARAELAAICEGAGVVTVADPANGDERFDRTHARALLARTEWLDAAGLARSAANLREADDALAWFADRCWAENVHEKHREGALEIDAAGLPHDTCRRLIERAFLTLTGAPCPAEHLDGFVRRLASGRHASCAGINAGPGPPWRLEHAPPRRSRAPAGG